MKILLCCEFYAPSVGGVQEVMKQLAERLVARGHAVTIATSAMSTREFKHLNGVQIQEFTVSGNLVNGMKGNVTAYRQFVTTGDFDVVMIKAAQQWTFDALWPVLDDIPGSKVFIPCGFSCLHEPAYSDYFRQLPSVLKRFDHLIFYASQYRDIEFAKRHGLTNWSILPNGASEEEFKVAKQSSFRRRYGLSDTELLFLTVGSPSSMKGHRELVEAFGLADFAGRPARLFINAGASLPRIRSSSRLSIKAREYWRVIQDIREKAGWASAFGHMIFGVLNKFGCKAGPYRCQQPVPQKDVNDDLTTWIAKIHKQSATKQVVLTDLPRAELIQAYMSADLFVFTSCVEYSPLVLFESAAAGVPFLSVPVGNAAEIAEWTGAGVICPAPQDERGYTRVDPQRFADQWAQLVSDPIRLRALGRTGRERWHSRFTWQIIVEQYEKCFQGMTVHART